MAVLSKQEFIEKWGDKFAENTIQNVDEAMLRDFRQDIADSFADVGIVRAPTAPDYAAGTIYGRGALVLYGLPKRFYQAKVPGLLLEPVPGQETEQWLPVAAPLSPLLPYREMAVIQGQDWGSEGLLEPSKLYRLTGRVDAITGDAVDDVLVVALSRHHVNSADAYAIGQDAQTREEYLLPVSYDLLTDTTAPRAAGGGGAVDAYTKTESDELLATKGSKQVQDQHTLQLNTLGVQASPAMAYLETGGVAGYSTLGEAVADAQAKTFMRFNVATVQLTQSNDPLNPGWAAYVDGAGATLELGANVVLSLPGSNLGTLLFRNFFIFQTPGTRGGRVKLLATGNADTPPGLLPLLDGQCSVPLELSGGAYALTGAYVSLLGTGTVHLFEPYNVDYVADGVTLVEHKSGGGASEAQLATKADLDASGRVPRSQMPRLHEYTYPYPAGQTASPEYIIVDYDASGYYAISQATAGLTINGYHLNDVLVAPDAAGRFLLATQDRFKISATAPAGVKATIVLAQLL
jgi:hypothetical protein